MPGSLQLKAAPAWGPAHTDMHSAHALRHVLAYMSRLGLLCAECTPECRASLTARCSLMSAAEASHKQRRKSRCSAGCAICSQRA